MFRPRNKVKVVIAFLVLLGVSFVVLNQKFNYFASNNSSSTPTYQSPTQVVRNHLSGFNLVAQSAIEETTSIPNFSASNIPYVLDTVFNNFDKAVCPQETELSQIIKENHDVQVGVPLTESKTVDGITCQYTLSASTPKVYQVVAVITLSGTNQLTRNLNYQTTTKLEEPAQISNVNENNITENNITATKRKSFEIADSNDSGQFTNTDQYIMYEGDVGLVYKQNINTSQDILDFYLKGPLNNIFTIDRSKSKWKIQAQGMIDYKFNLSINDRKAEIISINACENSCRMTTTENQEIYASSSIAQQNTVTGDIYSKVTHIETYSGHMIFNNSNKTLRWSDDLLVTKTDDRIFRHNLTRKDENGFISAKWVWEKNVDSVASLRPTQNNYSYIKDHVVQNMNINNFWLTCPNCTQTVQNSQKVLINKTESNTSTNSTSTITREGTGSYEINNPQSDVEHRYQLPRYKQYNGVYDNDDTTLKITSAQVRGYQMTDPDTGSELIGNRIDPMIEIDSVFTQSYLPDLKIPGEFTIKDNNIAIMTSPKIKALPSNIVVFNSDPETHTVTSGDSVTTGISYSGLDAVKAVLAQIKVLNPSISIRIVNTFSKNAMLTEIKNVPNGAWLINVGHGMPYALQAGNDLVYYSELSTILNKNNIKLDLFAGNTCFSAHSPLAETIIGSIGVGIVGDPMGQIYGSLFGIGGNSFSRTTADVMSAIMEAYQTGLKSSSPNLWPKVLQQTNPTDTLNF